MGMFVFLICTERSGSNFITNLVGGFPTVSAPPPTHLFRLFANARSHYGDLARDRNWEILIGDVVENLNAKLGTWRTTVTADELQRQARRRDPFELLRLIYEKEAAADAAAHSFIKENHTHRFAATLANAYADCRFVMMVRDPRDVASSWLRTDSIPGGVREAVDTWETDQREALPVFEALQTQGRVLFLRYEDLIAEPRSQLEVLADFIGIPFDESVFEFYRNTRTQANAARISAWRNTQRPIMQDNAGSYRRTLSQADIRYVELRCAALMRNFGYDLETVGSDSESDHEEIESLAAQVNPGRYRIDSEQEAAIRKRRLDALERVLARRLT